MIRAPDSELYLAEDHQFDYFVTERDPSTRLEVPSTGLTLKCFISATEDEDAIPIDASLSMNPINEAAADGYYYGSFDQANVEAHLTSYVGRKVYRILEKAGDKSVSTPLTVKRIRRA